MWRLDHLAVYLVLALFCMTPTVITENSYLFVSPKSFRAGTDLVIQGSLLTVPKQPVDVTLTIEKMVQHFNGMGMFELPPLPSEAPITPALKHEPISIASIRFTDTKTQEIRLQIPSTVEEGYYDLNIEGTGGLTFGQNTKIDYERKSHSIFMQTDKAIYKPGQTVHFRVFGVTSDLRIKFDGMDIDAFDPSGNKINQWRVPKKEVVESGGVVVHHVVMSDAPIMGDWKLKVVLGKEKAEKAFTVDEYVLPKFEVTVDLPAFGLRTDKFEGKIKATYTFGKPVKGVAYLRIKPREEKFKLVNGTRTKISKEIDLQLKIDGTATFTVPKTQMEEVQAWMGRSNSWVVFDVNVTETLTGAQMSDSAEIQFFDQAHKMEFPDSLPDFFKPGMTYLAVLKVSEQDGTPPSITKGKVTVNVSFYKPEVPPTTTTTKPQPIMIDDPGLRSLILPEETAWRGWWQGPVDVEFKQPVQTFHIPADGLIEISITVPAGVKRVEINALSNDEIRFQAEYDKDIWAYKSLNKAHSPSESFIQIRLLTDKPKTGDVARVEVRSTERQGEATYQVISKGNIVASGQVDLGYGQLLLPITSTMAPKAKLIVYHTRPNGEIVPDGLSFNVEGIFNNKVNMYFNKTGTVLPAEKIKLTVKADAGSKVNVLAVDKSVMLLKSGNDITKDQVRKELQSYDPKDRHSVCDWFCWRWPMSTGGTDARQIFNNAGVIYLTDALVYQYQEPFESIGVWETMRMDSNIAFMDSPGIREMAGPGPDMAFGNPSPQRPPSPPPTDLKKPTRTRKHFPETWLWKTETSMSNGVAEFEDTVPDTITSWVATAFAVHPDTGFGLSESATTLTTFKPFFVSLHMPYSVIRNEKVIIQANVFNYSPAPVFTMITLQENLGFENIHITRWYRSTYSARIARFITIKPNSGAAVYFPIVPRDIGKVDLNVQARSMNAADAIKKQLLVEPEGTPQEYNVPVLIDLKNIPDFTTTVPISFPPTAVKGSERVRVTAIGDLMGPSINGLDALLKMPYGCGEQNMLNFAPNIFITKYLEVTSNLDDVTLEKSRKFMIKGYQKELTYQHKDGSFSAFGQSDPAGSMWLSAFVLKSFVQAKPYIFVDDKVIHKTIDFILKYQNANGTFQEPGRVLHKEMQGGSSAGERSLMAFVLAALLEARALEGVNARISDAVSKAVAFLEADVELLTDVYELAIASYVLVLAGSPKAPVVMAKLESLAVVQENMKHWAKADAKTPVMSSNPWERRQHEGKAMNIELTAYGLLTLAANDDQIEGLHVLKWLTSQRNPNGGYSSTQDTIVALQALAEMASKIYSKDFNMNITVTGPKDSLVSENFTITPSNALVFQSRELPTTLQEVTVSATGVGLGLVEVAAFYNIDKDDQKPSFDLKVTVLDETLNEYKAQVCTSYLEAGVSSMAVIEIGSPSGFRADKRSINPHPLLKRTEDGDRKVILYLDEIGPQEICFTVSMERHNLVAGAQPVPVKVYDYYEPTNQVTQFYVPNSVSKSDVCGICKEECTFCNQNKQPMW